MTVKTKQMPSKDRFDRIVSILLAPHAMTTEQIQACREQTLADIRTWKDDPNLSEQDQQSLMRSVSVRLSLWAE